MLSGSHEPNIANSIESPPRDEDQGTLLRLKSNFTSILTKNKIQNSSNLGQLQDTDIQPKI